MKWWQKVRPGALPFRLRLVTQAASCIFKDVLRQNSPAQWLQKLGKNSVRCPWLARLEFKNSFAGPGRSKQKLFNYTSLQLGVKSMVTPWKQVYSWDMVGAWIQHWGWRGEEFSGFTGISRSCSVDLSRLWAIPVNSGINLTMPRQRESQTCCS